MKTKAVFPGGLVWEDSQGAGEETKAGGPPKWFSQQWK